MVSPSSSKDFRHVRRATVLRDSTGTRIRIGGYRPDKQQRNPQRFSASGKLSAGTRSLPSIVDLRPFMTAVEDQRDSNSCTANAIAGAYEYLENRLYGEADDVSRLFVYYNARTIDNSTHQDEGTYLSYCVKVLRKYGACSEQTWPFKLQQITTQPPKRAYREAAQFRIEAAESVEIAETEMRQCLAAGYPFVFGLQLFGSFSAAGGNSGLVPMPDPDRETHDGGHAMLCVGYSDVDRVFIVRNSWGDAWGDAGYCYVPYEYMTDPNLNHDCWVIRQVSDRSVDFSQDIQPKTESLFSGRRSEMARSLRTPGVRQTPSGIPLYDYRYHVTYEEQQVYINDDRGYVNINEVENLEELYYLEYEDEYEEPIDETWYEADENLEDSDYEEEGDYEEESDYAEEDSDYEEEGDYEEEESDYEEEEDSDYEEEGEESGYEEEGDYEEEDSDYEEEEESDYEEEDSDYEEEGYEEEGEYEEE